MNKIKLNPLVEQLQGGFGDLVFRQTSTGHIFVSHKPDMSNVVWSEAQAAQRARFKAATAYARAALADETVRALYEREAAAKGRQPFRLAMSDYFEGRDLLAKK